MNWIPQPTHDGSFTFFSEEFGEAFHSTQGAKAEALSKFAQATDLAQQADRGQICLLDVCYGLGYNSAAAIETIWQANPNCKITLFGLEQDPSVPIAAIDLLGDWSISVQSALRQIAQAHSYQSDRLAATLLVGDARQTIRSLQIQADAIFFDPFSPRRCPQLWTVEFFGQVARCLAPTGKLATYSRSASVRSAMRAAGLSIGTIPLGDGHLPHEWSQGTVAAYTEKGLHPLSKMEQEHLQTRAAVPYRDPNLNDKSEKILQRHQQEQQRSTLESTSSWRRRWQIH